MNLNQQENFDSFEQEKEVDLKNYLRVIRKRKWVIIFIFLIVVISVATHTHKLQPVYKATTRLLIDKENPNVISFAEVMSMDGRSTEYYQTQFKIIKSRNIIDKVIKELKLDEPSKVVPTPKNPSMRDMLISNVKDWLKMLKNKVKPEKIEATLVETTAPEIMNDPELRKQEQLYRRIVGPLNVKPIPGSRLVDLDYTGYNPQKITKIVNTIARVYIEQNLENRLYASEDAAIWLDERLTSMQEKVENSERALQIYSKNAGVTSIEDKRKMLEQQLLGYNAELTLAAKNRVKLERKYKNAQNSALANTLSEIISNELIQNLNKDLSVLKAKQSELEGKYGSKHPKMIQIISQINQISSIIAIEIKKIHDNINTKYQLALIEEQSLKDALSKFQEEAAFLNEKSIRYGVLKREAASNRRMYEVLLKRLKETDLSQGLHTNNIRIIDKGLPPLSPFKPDRKRNNLIGIIFGLLSGIGLAFFIEYLDNTVKEPDEIPLKFGIPFLGLVGSHLGDGKKMPASDKDPSASIQLVAYKDPSSNISESLRTIRTNVIFSADGDKEKVFMVTSSLPGEGKTTVAANLAVVMASLGEKVLLIDADLRRPSVHKAIKIPKTPGISSYLIRQKEISEIIVDTQIKNLSVIPSGITPPNPSELLSHPQMKTLLEYARKNYDRVIVDTPPVASVTDPIIISRQAHSVLFVIRSGSAPRDAVAKSIQQLRHVKANILGAVLNGVDFSKDSYYYQYYYKHYYYKDEDKDEQST